MDRLERSRRALELHRTAYPNLTLSQQGSRQISSQELSQALWNTELHKGPRSSDIFAPFIVPSVLDFLRSSKWAKKIFVVAGEADSFCADAAKHKKAAILTNDSDLVLFEDVDTVVLLTSLAFEEPVNQSSKIQARCWRPEKIAKQLGLQSLSCLGFARANSATGSFNAVLQSAKELQEKDDSLEFLIFKGEFASNTAMSNTPDELHDLDPRFAEVVCQLSRPLDEEKVNMTLPVLLEDSTRDASWSYGKDIRRLAYSILITSLSPSQTTEVIEYSRKGPGIIASTFNTLRAAECEQLAQTLLRQMRRYSSKLSPNIHSTCLWNIYALSLVWRQRIENGKGSLTSHTLAITLGLAPWPTGDYQRTTMTWDVMHLNANVQAVLYSIRLLTQSMRFSSSLPSNKPGLSVLKEVLGQMPTIDKVFRTPAETRESFRNLSRGELEALLLPFATDFDLASILGLEGPKDHSIRPTQQTAEKRIEVGEFVVAGAKRKRLKAQRKSPTSPAVTVARSKNLFDILSGSA